MTTLALFFDHVPAVQPRQGRPGVKPQIRGRSTPFHRRRTAYQPVHRATPEAESAAFLRRRRAGGWTDSPPRPNVTRPPNSCSTSSPARPRPCRRAATTPSGASAHRSAASSASTGREEKEMRAWDWWK